jgi:hypothetical protein
MAPLKRVTSMANESLVKQPQAEAPGHQASRSEEPQTLLARRNAVTAVSELQARSAERGLSSMPVEEIDAEIRAARRSGPRRAPAQGSS